VGQSY